MYVPAPSSAQSTTGITPQLIDRLFLRFAQMYGEGFFRMWDGQPLAEVKAQWLRSLQDMTPAQIALGVQACEERIKRHPSLPEFRLLCSPPPDHERLFALAQRYVSQTYIDGWAPWPDPMLFNIVLKIGFARIRGSSWERIAGLWMRTYSDLLNADDLVRPPSGTEARIEKKLPERDTVAARLQAMRAVLRAGASSTTERVQPERPSVAAARSPVEV